MTPSKKTAKIISNLIVKILLVGVYPSTYYTPTFLSKTWLSIRLRTLEKDLHIQSANYYPSGIMNSVGAPQAVWPCFSLRIRTLERALATLGIYPSISPP